MAVIDGGSCSDGVVTAVITYVVTSVGGDGTDVSVSVDRVGRGNEHYGHGTGVLGEPISVNVSVAGDCNS